MLGISQKLQLCTFPPEGNYYGPQFCDSLYTCSESSVSFISASALWRCRMTLAACRAISASIQHKKSLLLLTTKHKIYAKGAGDVSGSLHCTMLGLLKSALHKYFSLG